MLQDMPEGWPGVPGAPRAALRASGLPLAPMTQDSPLGGPFRPAYGHTCPPSGHFHIRVSNGCIGGISKRSTSSLGQRRSRCVSSYGHFLSCPSPWHLESMNLHRPPTSTPACSSALGFRSSDGQPLGSAHTLPLQARRTRTQREGLTLWEAARRPCMCLCLPSARSGTF